MRAKTYSILKDAIEEGIFGFLYNDLDDEDYFPKPLEPSKVEFLGEKCLNRVMNSICERFHFGADNYDPED